MSNDKHQRDTRAGIDRMAQHAREMHASGKLSQGELRDLAKWLITKGAESLSMEEYVQERKSGDFDKAWAATGPEGDDKRDADDVRKAGERIGRKVAGDFVSDLWVGGDLDAKKYSAMMSAYGIGPADLSTEKVTDAITSKADAAAGEIAEKLWLHNNENSVAETAAPEPSEKVSADDVAEFRERQGGDQSGGTVEHERTVNAPRD